MYHVSRPMWSYPRPTVECMYGSQLWHLPRAGLVDATTRICTAFSCASTISRLRPSYGHTREAAAKLIDTRVVCASISHVCALLPDSSAPQTYSVSRRFDMYLNFPCWQVRVSPHKSVSPNRHEHVYTRSSRSVSIVRGRECRMHIAQDIVI